MVRSSLLYCIHIQHLWLLHLYKPASIYWISGCQLEFSNSGPKILVTRYHNPYIFQLQFSLIDIILEDSFPCACTSYKTSCYTLKRKKKYKPEIFLVLNTESNEVVFKASLPELLQDGCFFQSRLEFQGDKHASLYSASHWDVLM